MTELSPSLLELKAELARAIRQDHQRRERRRKTIRTSAMSLGAFAAMSGSALAAGDALGVIDLGGGSSAAPSRRFRLGRRDRHLCHGHHRLERDRAVRLPHNRWNHDDAVPVHQPGPL